mmetsp:Transcript_5541/g.14862  ORF Transcript_5541/g.14862 Transcript_5541/m.14862 type:complete len:217 (+) Transcript_5541:2000-2650(+)
MSGSLSCLKHRREIDRLSTSCWTSCFDFPGVALSATMRMAPFVRRNSSLVSRQTAEFPRARCASSITSRAKRDASILPPTTSFSTTCAVANTIVERSWSCQIRSRASAVITPDSSVTRSSASPVVSNSAMRCCANSGFVGAINSAFAVGNQCSILSVTSAAMRVFPRPVGRHMRVFPPSPAAASEIWYGRKATFVGTIQLEMASGSASSVLYSDCG